MPYSTLDDLKDQVPEDELIQLTDDEELGQVDQAVAAKAIADADAEIDSYCGTRYDVPFTAVPPIIRKLSVDMAIYNLYARRRRVPDDRKERYDGAVRFLRDVSRGMISLGAGSPAPDADSGPQVTTSTQDRVFTVGSPSRGTTGTLDNY
jgi:phage gp36-like protein